MFNLLLLTPQLPYPPHQGTSLRNYHILRGLAGRYSITLLSFLESHQTADPAAIAPLLDLCSVHTVSVPARSTLARLWQFISTRRPDMAHRLYSKQYEEYLRHMLQETRFDIVQIEGIEMARYSEIIRVVSPESKVIFDDHNAETELQRRNFATDIQNPRRWLAAAYSWFQTRRLSRFERWAIHQADRVTTVSEADKQSLEMLGDSALQFPISVIPNCIDVAEYQNLVSSNSAGWDLVFIGKMDYRPNVDAVLWFADEVWPLIRQIRPSAQWAVVGQKPHPRLARLHALPGLLLTGWVESVAPYLAGAAVFIMPFRIGSGTRLKLIEAMAAGKAVVSTPVGAEGFAVQHGRELLLAETAKEMAAAVLHLLEHPEERRRLGQTARIFAREYDWRHVIPQFDVLYREVVNRPNSGGYTL